MKVLIIRLSSMGDVLLTTPVVRIMRQQMPDAEIHFLTKSSNVPILANNPNIDKIYTLQDDMSRTIAELKGEHYDRVIDLHNVPRARKIRRALATTTTCYNKENLHKYLYIITKRASIMSGRHVVERYADAVGRWGLHLDSEGLDFYLSETLREIAYPKIAARIGLPQIEEGTPYTVIACGAQHYTKRIPVENIAHLCNRIASPTLLLGDDSDGRRIAESSVSWPQNTIDLCGKTSLEETAALVRDASAVITPDTGIMHIAAAFHSPLLAVWGATAPPLGFTPYRTPYYSFEAPHVACHPCSRQGGEHCRHKHFRCMKEQPWDEIAATANNLIYNTSNLNKRPQTDENYE